VKPSRIGAKAAEPARRAAPRPKPSRLSAKAAEPFRRAARSGHGAPAGGRRCIDDAAAGGSSMPDDRLARVCAWFESISPQSLRSIDEIYTADAYFKDSFNEVRGAPAIGRILARMFEQVGEPRFVVRQAVAQGDDAFLTWDFLFRIRRLGDRERTMHGASHLKFAADGRIRYHRDYCDIAEELYEKLPVLGGLMRLLKRQAAR
jgi:steroid delta-isomerase